MVKAGTWGISLLKVIRKVLLACGGVGLFGLLWVVGVSLLARWLWAGEVLVSLLWLQLPFTLAFLVFLLFLRAWRMAAVAAICVLWMAVQVVPYLSWPGGANAAVEPAPGAIRVASINLRIRSNYLPEKIRSVRDINPDIAFLQEVDGESAKALESLKDIYPYIQTFPRETPFGSAVLSRYPLLHVEDHEVERSGALEVTFEVDGVAVSAVDLHPYPPGRPRNFHSRNRQLKQMREMISSLPRPLIVAGDLNASVWSPHYKDFVSELDLHDPRLGRGLLLSFPAFSAIGPYTPIDHVLVSKDIEVEQLSLAKIADSDHRGVVATIRLPSNP